MPQVLSAIVGPDMEYKLRARRTYNVSLRRRRWKKPFLQNLVRIHIFAQTSPPDQLAGTSSSISDCLRRKLNGLGASFG
jgi:hypothetical protein